jgi:hypothetical protein
MRVLDVQVDAYLTGFARDYNYNTPDMFIADVIAPKKQVSSSSYLYKYFGQEILSTWVDDTKAPKGGVNSVDFDVSETTGTITTRALKHFVDDETIQQEVDPVKAMEDGTAFVVSALNMRREIRVATVAAATSNATGPTYDWDNASATPLQDIATYKATLRASLGSQATHIVAHSGIWDELAVAAGLTGVTKYQPFWNVLTATGEKMSNEPILGLTPVNAGALKNSADEGATVTPTWVWSDDAFLIHVSTGTRGVPWAMQPMVNDIVITRWRDEERGGWWIKGEHKIGFKEVTAAAIYEISDVT